MTKIFLALVCGLLTISACESGQWLPANGETANQKSALMGTPSTPITAPSIHIGTTRGELDVEALDTAAIYGVSQTNPGVEGHGPTGVLGASSDSGHGGVEGVTDNSRAFGILGLNYGGGYGLGTPHDAYVGGFIKVDGDIDGENNSWGAASGPISCPNDGVTVCSCPNGLFQTGTVFNPTGVSQIYCNKI